MKKLAVLLVGLLVLSSANAGAWEWGSGYKDGTPAASDITTDTSNFNNNLSSTDTDVQKALDTLDNMIAGSTGLISSSALTMHTGKLLGRSTSGTGAIEELTVGSGLSLSSGTLSSTGGTPAGSDTDVQYNNSSAFGATDAHYNSTSHRTGYQVTAANAKATIHADAVYGDTVSAPASLTATKVEDTAIDSPASGSATQVTKPTDPTTPTVDLIKIDHVVSATPNQNTMSSGYTANGQTISYTIYAYRTVSGVRVVNPNYYSTSFTDTINDGSTAFAVDINSITTSDSMNTYWDGFIIDRTDDGGSTHYVKDIGSNQNYTDSAFTDNDSFSTSSYAESATTWNGNVAQYKTLGGGEYRGAFVTGTSATDDNSGMYLVLHVYGWGSLSDDGFIIQRANSSYEDLGTSTSYYDYGQSGTGDVNQFASYAFPQFNTTLTAATSASASFNYGSGAYTANNDYWSIDVYEYRYHPVTNQKYYTSAAHYDLGYDANDASSFSIDWSCSAGDGDGRLVVLSQSSIPIYEYDATSGTASGNLNSTSSITSRTDISSYSGITRDYDVYGWVASPSTKYSSTPKTYSFTDTNPTGGYLIQHDWATFGNAAYLKAIETADYRSAGYIYASSPVATFYETNTSLGDAVVTPNTIGFLSNGSNLNRAYSVYSTQSVNGTTIYSSTAATASTTDTNDGKYYTVDLSWSSVSGATYKLKRIVNGGSSEYKTSSGTTLSDSTSQTWNAASTLTPTQAPGATIIADRSSTAITDPANLIVRNPTTSPYTSVDFQYNQSGSGTYTSVGKISSDTSGRLEIATGNLASGGVDFTNASNTAHVRIQAGSSTSGNIFNVQGAQSRDTTFKGSSVTTLMRADTTYDQIGFGHASPNWASDASSCVFIEPTGSDVGLSLSPTVGSSDTNLLARLINSSATVWWSLSNAGRMGVYASSSASGNLYIGSSNSSYSQLQFALSGTVPSTPVRGGIEFSNYESPYSSTGALYFTDNANTRRRIQIAFPTSDSNKFPYVDSYGNLTVTSNPLSIVSGVILQVGSAYQALFAGGAAISAGKDLSMGTTSNLLMGTTTSTMYPFPTKLVAKTANYTLTNGDVGVNCTSGTFTITLPTAVGHSRNYWVKNSGSGTITINTTSSQTIDGAASGAITLAQYESIWVQSDGANWIRWD